MRIDHKQISYTRLATNRGKPRLWLESLRLAACGFEPGVRYNLIFDLDARRVILRIDADGDRLVSSRSRTLSNGDKRQVPIIDIASASLRDTFEEGQKLRAVLATGEIVFDLHPMEVAREEREARTERNVQDGCVREATLCTGGGVSTWAMQEGLEAAGLRTQVDWVVDREGRYLEVACQNNPAITDATRLYEATLEEVDLCALTPVDVLQVSLPCTGHSLSGKAKRNLKCAEDHPTDALAVYGLLRILEAVNPSVVVSENVKQAANSASYAIVRAYLLAQGYNITEAVIDGEDAGTIENRERWWLVATSAGLDAGTLDLADLPRQPRRYATLGEVMEPLASEDPAWKDYAYLDAKAARDKADGKGFARQFVDAASTTLGTIGKGYQKARSTEPFIKGADGKQRLLTPVEHARVKGIPESLVDGTPATLAHEILGQSILFPHAKAIAQLVGRHLLRAFGPSDEMVDIEELADLPVTAETKQPAALVAEQAQQLALVL